MKQKRIVFVSPLFVIGILLSIFFFGSCSKTQNLSHKKQKLNVVIVTGGHGFEEKPFFEMFDSFDNIEYVESRQEKQTEIFEDISDWNYDVIVLYNMNRQISPKQRKNFIKLLNKGVGLVAMHHCIGAFGDWPEYRKIIGGKYYFEQTVENGVVQPKSQYKEGLDFTIHINNPNHPVSRGLKDFKLHDETYKKCWFEKDNKVLLSTTEPTSDGPVCWVRHYGNARVCYIQTGHGSAAYGNPAYRQLLSQAINWCGTMPNLKKNDTKKEGGKKMEIKVTSSAFEEEGMIPAKYTCDGEDISPPLQWDDIPQETKSIALISDDPDAPMGTWVHWVLFNLPADTRQLKENIPPDETLANGAKHGTTDFHRLGYGGPCPPSGTHRYFFKVYALDTILDLAAGATKSQLLKAIQGHTLAQGQLMGKYKRR